MFTTKEFYGGLVIGIAAVWAYHHFISPLPAPAKG